MIPRLLRLLSALWFLTMLASPAVSQIVDSGQPLLLEVRTPLGHKFNTDTSQRVSLRLPLADVGSAALLPPISVRVNEQPAHVLSDSLELSLTLHGLVRRLRVELLVDGELPAEAIASVRAVYCEDDNEEYCVVYDVEIPVRQLREEGATVVRLPVPSTAPIGNPFGSGFGLQRRE